MRISWAAVGSFIGMRRSPVQVQDEEEEEEKEEECPPPRACLDLNMFITEQ
jgi:hypothetical protein